MSKTVILWWKHVCKRKTRTLQIQREFSLKTRIFGRNQDFYECDENTFVITNKNSTDKTRILYIKQELDSDNKNPLSKSGF